ncbi:MAG TPA: hypothetical protein VGC24_10655 [Burkholderiaceae bacterium]
MRAVSTSSLLLLALAAAQPGLAQAPAEPATRPDQRIERIHIEDGGSSVDELRVGGQTQSITVQPKADVPEYEVLPQEGTRTSPVRREGAESGTGTRVWNMLKF